MPPAPTLNGTPDEKAAVRRQLKIKVAAAKRLLKEHILYRDEAHAQGQKLSKLAEENADEWELKHAASVKNKPEFENDEELVKAEEALKEANAH